MKSPEEMAQEAFVRRNEHSISKAKKKERRRVICSRLSALALVVVVAGTIGAGYVFAATFNIGDLFKSIFAFNHNISLSENQVAYLDERVASIGESVTQDGVTVTIEGALTDGTTAYILVDIIAPEYQIVDSIPLGFDIEFEKLKLEGQEKDHITNVATTCIPLADNDGKENTASMLIQYNVYQFMGSNFSLADGKNRTLQLRNLYYYEEEYPYSRCTVAEGKWEYEFAFAAVENKEVELLKAPISGFYSQISGKQVQTTITSILMKGLSASVYYTLSPDEVQEAGDFGNLKFVMKDGSVIYAHPQKAGQTAQIENGNLIPNTVCHYCSYVFDAPINYEDIETLYLGETAIKIEIQ